MVILDTCIKANVDKNTLDAFLYGQITGSYKLYKELDSSKLSIRFDNDEDATSFKLKALDEVFMEKFDVATNNMRGIFDNMALKNHSHTGGAIMPIYNRTSVDWLGKD